jgi:MFS family permease
MAAIHALDRPDAVGPVGMPARRHGGRFIAMAVLLSIVMAGATLASPLYPLYRHTLGFSAGDVTIAYASYMVGALVALALAAHLAEHMGYARAMALSGLVLLAGLALSALAQGLAMLVAGRALIGIAAGIASASGTAGLVALEPRGDVARATRMGAVATIAGLGLGPLLGGVLAQLAPAPLSTPYGVVGGLALVWVALLWMVPADAAPHPWHHFRPHVRMRRPERRHARPFALVSASAFLGYALFGIFASLAPSLLDQMLPWSGPAIGGAGVALLFAGSTLAQLIARDLGHRAGVIAGALVVVISLILLVLSLIWSSGPLFLLSDLIAGFGQGLGFLAALGFVGSIVPDDKRAGLIATFFASAYLGGVLPVMGMGLLADRIGSNPAIAILAVALAALGLMTALFGWRILHPPLRDAQ